MREKVETEERTRMGMRMDEGREGTRMGVDVTDMGMEI
jgi:hypothetical protein